MAILTDVKQALGIFYDEPVKNAEISGIIAGAKAFLLNAGWPSSDLTADEETDLAKQAIITYAKMAVNTDPNEMKMNPVLVGMIVQARAIPAEEETSETTETTTAEGDGE